MLVIDSTLKNNYNPHHWIAKKASPNERPRRKQTGYPARIFIYKPRQATGYKTHLWELKGSRD